MRIADRNGLSQRWFSDRRRPEEQLHSSQSMKISNRLRATSLPQRRRGNVAKDGFDPVPQNHISRRSSADSGPISQFLDTNGVGNGAQDTHFKVTSDSWRAVMLVKALKGGCSRLVHRVRLNFDRVTNAAGIHE